MQAVSVVAAETAVGIDTPGGDVAADAPQPKEGTCFIFF